MKRQETPLPPLPPPQPQPQQPPPSLPPYFFTPPQNPQVLPENMDWASMLLSCPTVPASMEAAAGTSSTTFSQNSSRAEDQDYDRHKDKRRTGRSRKTATRPRVEFQTRSTEDILDDGYRWRKYGQKSVKNSNYPRSYYRCTHITCNVKKQVQRLSNDTGIVVTTYEGIHNHPCEKLMETLSPLLRQMQFLARF